MEITLTAKIKLIPSNKQISLLQETLKTYRDACNFVSKYIFDTHNLTLYSIQKVLYYSIRNNFGLRSQMAISVIRTVIARYKSCISNGHEWTLVKFKKLDYDLVWNRDYSIVKNLFSLNTLSGRVKVSFEVKSNTKYFDGSWSFGTCKLVYKQDKWYLHIPVSKTIPDVLDDNISQVVGIDFGINFTATSYDSDGKTLFFSGRAIKHKRAKYMSLRKQLQKKQTPSSRRKLKTIGNRENRFVTDVNHSVSKALVSIYGSNTLFVLEDLTGVRNATEKAHVRNRYVSVSWAFYQLRQFLEYKAALNGAKVIAVNPAYTSQMCPIHGCKHTEHANRNKKKHIFRCKKCGYTSNDDRVGAMNLQMKGIKYISEVAKGA